MDDTQSSNTSMPAPEGDIGSHYDHGFLVASTVIMAFLAVAMALGNIFVIVTLVVVKALLSASDQLILNLCSYGVVLGLVVMPYGTMTTFLRIPVWGEVMCKVMALITFTAIYGMTCTLTAIAVDRYLKVKHNSTRSFYFKKTWLLCVLIWLFSFLCALPPMCGWGVYEWDEGKPICSNDWIASTSYTIFIVILLLCIPLVIMVYGYGSIVRIVVQSRRRLADHQRCHNRPDIVTIAQAAESAEIKPVGSSGRVEPARWAGRAGRRTDSFCASAMDAPSSHAVENVTRPQERVKGPEAGPKSTRPVNRADIAVIRTMIIVVSTYVIFWFPYIICTLIKTATQEKMSFVVETVTHEIAFLGIAFNPIIYAVFNKNFRRTLETAIKKLKKSHATN